MAALQIGRLGATAGLSSSVNSPCTRTFAAQPPIETSTGLPRTNLFCAVHGAKRAPPALPKIKFCQKVMLWWVRTRNVISRPA
jgi:hypothetical protein